MTKPRKRKRSRWGDTGCGYRVCVKCGTNRRRHVARGLCSGCWTPKHSPAFRRAMAALAAATGTVDPTAPKRVQRTQRPLSVVRNETAGVIALCARRRIRILRRMVARDIDRLEHIDGPFGPYWMPIWIGRADYCELTRNGRKRRFRGELFPRERRRRNALDVPSKRARADTAGGGKSRSSSK